jgi:hypothetical protein
VLDLDAIFNPDEPAPPVRVKACPQTDLGGPCRPEELPPEWHFLWEERAAIMEYDGKLSQERAEALAFQDILDQMRQASSLPRGGTCV